MEITMSEEIKNENVNPEDEFLVDLFDEDGNMQTFVHLDTVQVKGSDYVICIPHVEDEENYDQVDEVVILKMIKNAEGELELIFEEDNSLLETAYELFKERNADMFDFED
ncbi:MAG: DUF1292 domain-containing protein [Clostridia bacterium]|nr:DUF1292 domain-containing protein [Clostridia bacterium]